MPTLLACLVLQKMSFRCLGGTSGGYSAGTGSGMAQTALEVFLFESNIYVPD